MKLMILHLSDIHIKNLSDKVLSHSGNIARSCFERAREADKSLIIITGDLTYSGSTEQFAMAKDFIRCIKEKIEKEADHEVLVLTAPGNHDCCLTPESLTRTRIIESLHHHPEDAKNDEIVKSCTRAQDNYFSFRKEITTHSTSYEDSLWSEYEIDLHGRPIRISTINASWMSSLKEKPGTLIFPIGKYSEILKEPAYARLVLLHHPLNWYVQGTYHPMRVALHSHATAIFSGHEHTATSGLIQDNDNGTSLYYEAPALQPHESTAAPGFLNIFFDFKASKVTETRYKIESSSSIIPNETNTRELDLTNTKSFGKNDLTEEFDAKLRDPGAEFKDSHNQQVSIDDFYVYPEIEILYEENNSRRLQTHNSEEIISGDHTNARIIFMGDEWSGKTSLLLQAFKVYKKRGLTPIYLRVSELKGHSELDIQKFISRSVENQYIAPNNILSSPKESIIALIDDIDKIPGGGEATQKLLDNVKKHCSGIIMTSASGFEFSELINNEVWEATKDFVSYDILPFGSRLKHRLIKRWCMCGSVNNVHELEAKVHSAEKTLNSIIGKNLVPRVPIYILILLQSIDKNQQDILTNSHIGSYYGYMIDKNLFDAGILPSKFVEIKGYLSELAWFYKHTETKECALDTLVHFNNQYTTIQNTVSLESRLEQLTRAQILVARDGYYSFKYPYIYYYFVGKYLAKNLPRDDNLKQQVTSWCASLHKQDHAHYILFLVHHINDEWVIENIVQELDKSFSDIPTLSLEDNVSGLNTLVNKTSQLLLELPDVNKNQERIRQIEDDINRAEEQHTMDDKDVDPMTVLNKYNQLYVTSGILGQILKSYYGDIRRDARQQMLSKIFNATLRGINLFITTLMNDPDNLVAEIDKRVGSKLEEASPTERHKIIKQLIFQVIGAIATLNIKRAAQIVTSDDLKEDISSISHNTATVAYKLLRAASQLERPGKLPIDEIKALSNQIKDNTFAFGILQSLAVLHVQFFHMKDSDRQKLCAAAGISLVPPRSSDLVRETIS